MTPSVLIVHPPTTIARDFIDYPYFANLGALQLTAVLRAGEVPVTVVDAYALAGSTLAFRTDGRAHLGAPVEEVMAEVRRASFGLAVVAYTPFHRPPTRCDVLGELLEAVQAFAPDVPIVLADCHQSGQHYVEAAPDSVLRAYPEVSAWVKYESELTVPELLQTFGATGRLPKCALRGTPTASLDTLPVPAWDLIDLTRYDHFRSRVVEHLGRGAWAFPIDGRTLPLTTSRGCPFHCRHCSSNPGLETGEPKTQRRYSAAYLQKYLGTLVRQHGATRLAVLDELANVNERHFDTLLDELERLDVRFDMPNGLRADYLQPRHFERMKRRVTTVSVSAESAVQRVLDDIVDKNLDLSTITSAAENAHTASVPLMIHYMIGLPGETGTEINQTLAFAMDLWERFHAWPAVQFATPLPGTALAQGRTLPVLPDWGPAFQTTPSQPGALVSPDELRRFRWTFDQRLAASRGPEKLVVNVTYVCNNHCTFCAVGTRTQLHGHPTRQREHLLEYRRRGVTLVDFDGGEPTLNPELVPLVRYARAIGYEKINVTTNGRLCAYPEFAERLVRSGLTTLLFSLHGPDARIHAQQVGVPEAFEQTTAGIKNSLELAPPGIELGMNVTITRGNADHLEALAQLCWDLGLRWLNLQFLTPFGRATRFVAPDTEAAARTTMKLIDTWAERLKIQVINLPFCFMPGYERYLAGDLGKLSRHMVFVNNETVNLGRYLAERRVHKPVCGPCPHRIFCSGFYELDDVPEPPWIVSADDLVRRGTGVVEV
jgi:MoaA/NifB/PqqE/SkfB family radical SAM enzyme